MTPSQTPGARGMTSRDDVRYSARPRAISGRRGNAQSSAKADRHASQRPHSLLSGGLWLAEWFTVHIVPDEPDEALCGSLVAGAGTVTDERDGIEAGTADFTLCPLRDLDEVRTVYVVGPGRPGPIGLLAASEQVNPEGGLLLLPRAVPLIDRTNAHDATLLRQAHMRPQRCVHGSRHVRTCQMRLPSSHIPYCPEGFDLNEPLTT